MERDGTQNRKRTRDQEDEKQESHKGKKPEIMFAGSMDDIDSCYREKDHEYEFYDPIGVFDFPWLKEGVIFKVDEYLEPTDMFSSYVDQVVQDSSSSANLDQSYVQDSLVPPALDLNFYDKKFDCESLWPFQVDDFESLDCVSSSVVVDQPPNDVCLNKG